MIDKPAVRTVAWSERVLIPGPKAMVPAPLIGPVTWISDPASWSVPLWTTILPVLSRLPPACTRLRPLPALFSKVPALTKWPTLPMPKSPWRSRVAPASFPIAPLLPRDPARASVPLLVSVVPLLRVEPAASVQTARASTAMLAKPLICVPRPLQRSGDTASRQLQRPSAPVHAADQLPACVLDQTRIGGAERKRTAAGGAGDDAIVGHHAEALHGDAGTAGDRGAEVGGAAVGKGAAAAHCDAGGGAVGQDGSEVGDDRRVRGCRADAAAADDGAGGDVQLADDRIQRISRQVDAGESDLAQAIDERPAVAVGRHDEDLIAGAGQGQRRAVRSVAGAQHAALERQLRQCRIEIGEVEPIPDLEIGDGDPVQVRRRVLDLVIARAAGDDVAAAAGMDQIVEDGTCDDLSERRSLDQILLVRIETVDRDVDRIGAVPVLGVAMNADIFLLGAVHGDVVDVVVHRDAAAGVHGPEHRRGVPNSGPVSGLNQPMRTISPGLTRVPQLLTGVLLGASSRRSARSRLPR